MKCFYSSVGINTISTVPEHPTNWKVSDILTNPTSGMDIRWNLAYYKCYFHEDSYIQLFQLFGHVLDPFSLDKQGIGKGRWYMTLLFIDWTCIVNFSFQCNLDFKAQHYTECSGTVPSKLSSILGHVVEGTHTLLVTSRAYWTSPKCTNTSKIALVCDNKICIH